MDDGSAFSREQSHIVEVLEARAAAAEEIVADEHRRGEAAAIDTVRDGSHN